MGEARRFLLGTLPDAGDDDADALALMLSELATNAVQHAATEFEVSVRVAPDGGRVRVEVSDGAAGYPTPQDPVPDAPHGRGLHIVRALADAWGIEMRRDRPGKTVWFSVALAAPCRSGAAGSAAGGAGRVGAPAAPAAPAASVEDGPAWPVPGVRAVLDGLRDAVVATDEQGLIRYVNTAAEDLLGWPRGSLVGRPVFDLVPESLTATLGVDFGAFVRSRAGELVGRRLTPSSSGPTEPTSTRSWSSASSTTRSPAGWSWASSAPATRRRCSAGRS